MKRVGAVFFSLFAIASSAFAEKFLSVSDIHFNPFADPALVAKLEAADVSLRLGLAMADSIVYATALRFDAKLVTGDADFDDLPGAIVIR